MPKSNITAVKFNNTFFIIIIFLALSGLELFLFDNLPSWRFYWNLYFIFTPLFAGVFICLAQNKNKSYLYLPKLVLGSIIFAFLFIFITKLYFYFAENLRVSIINHFNPFRDQDEIFALLTFMGLVFFGGLVAIAGRALSELFAGKK